MIAAFAPTIPVIGLPIMPSDGNDMASLLSMTNMPNGVPVLTVGVDKVGSLHLLFRHLPGNFLETISISVSSFLEMLM